MNIILISLHCIARYRFSILGKMVATIHTAAHLHSRLRHNLAPFQYLATHRLRLEMATTEGEELHLRDDVLQIIVAIDSKINVIG